MAAPGNGGFGRGGLIRQRHSISASNLGSTRGVEVGVVGVDLSHTGGVVVPVMGTTTTIATSTTAGDDSMELGVVLVAEGVGVDGTMSATGTLRRITMVASLSTMATSLTRSRC